LLPTSTQPESVPFLLVKTAPVIDDGVMVEEHEEIDPVVPPAARSVPPHAPPAPRSTDEVELPSVIVDAAALDIAREDIALLVESELEEAQRASDVDVLLATSDAHIALETTRMTRSPASSSRGRGLAIATLLAIAAVGGTFAGLRAHGVSARAVGAALHIHH
jgi:hypothetical protein